MTFFTVDESKSLIEAASQIMSERKAGANLPKTVHAAAVEAGKATAGKSLEERSQILHHFFNKSVVDAQVEDKAFRPTNETVFQFNEVAMLSREQQMSAGSFDAVADDEGSPLSAEDRARINKRKMREGAEGAGSFEDVSDDEGSPLSAEDRARLKKRKVREGAEGAGSFEDVSDDEGSPLTPEQRSDIKKRKMREDAIAAIENLANFGGKQKKFPPDKDKDGKVNERLKNNRNNDDEDEDKDGKVDEQGNLANFGGKQKKFPPDKDKDGKVNEQETTGTEKEAEDTEQDERRVSVKAQTVRDIDDVPVSQTHSFVKESWTILVDTSGIELGEQHILAGNLANQEKIVEACASCPSDRSPFSVTVNGASETEAIENLVSALENIGSRLSAEQVLVAHQTPAKV